MFSYLLDLATHVRRFACKPKRMSGSSIANLLLDVLEYDWTDSALEDVEFTVDRARNILPFGSILPSRDSIVD